MRPSQLLAKIGSRVRLTVVTAMVLALAVLIAGIGLAVYGEHLSQAERLRRVTTQAEVVAASIAAPLAVEDPQSTGEYVNALRADRDIQAAGAYGADGKIRTGYVLSGPSLPSFNPSAKPVFRDGELTLSVPVVQGATRLGSVYIRTDVESAAHRAARYLGMALLVAMASILVAVLGASSASINEAHKTLKREIADRERAEEALRQAQKMEAMGQLTGGVAHDFNNLLMVASSGLDLMDRTTDPQRRERLKLGIRQAIERGSNLTQQLLSFSRRTPLKTEVVDLGGQLMAMRDLLDRSLREDITVQIDAAPDLWPVEVDPAQFEVAVLNIALNARDAMPNGGRIDVRLQNAPSEVENGADRVCVAISDSGVGVAPELIPRLFEPFFSTKGVGKGTGLGLSQVYGFARASGGEVRLESELSHGSTVYLLLPRSTRKVERGPAPAANPGVAAKGRRRILMVEDDDRVAELVGEMLSELGYEYSRAASAASALDALRPGQTFDLVFSDMVMPGEMSGLDLAHEIARRRPELPVVLTSGYSASAAAAATEGLRLLVKPYRLDALAAELQAAMGQPVTGQTRH